MPVIYDHVIYRRDTKKYLGPNGMTKDPEEALFYTGPSKPLTGTVKAHIFKISPMKGLIRDDYAVHKIRRRVVANKIVNC